MRKELKGAWVPPGRRRRHRLAMGASLASAAAICLSWAGTAGAASTPPVNPTVHSDETGSTYSVPGAQPQNNIITGSGSQTTYALMQAMDSLFNHTPGCNITTTSFTYVAPASQQELNYSCLGTTVPSADGGLYGAAGVTSEQIPPDLGAAGGDNAYLDNPVNDIAVSQSAMGSSNGIAQLEEGRDNQASGSGGNGIGDANSVENISYIDYARSSRKPGSADIQGLNFVAYATDGVSWIHWTKTSAGATPSAKVSSLTQAQLQGIWNGTIYNWAQVGGKAAPIIVYAAQEGSGTQATWKSFMGFDPTASTNSVNCASTPSPSGKPAVYPAGPGTNCAGPDTILENELTSVEPSTYADAIMFYSLGRYADQCGGEKLKAEAFDKTVLPGLDGTVNSKVGADCGGGATTGASGKIILGSINGIAPTPQSVLNGSFPDPRDVYNVYSNGSNPNIPPATAATLNYVSEIGFVCKPETVSGNATPTGASDEIVDPATGIWYATEIENTILQQGFIPLDATASGPTYADLSFPTGAAASEGSVGHTAISLLASDAGGATYLDVGGPAVGPSGVNTSIPTAPNPPGYCAVSTTDGNANQ